MSQEFKTDEKENKKRKRIDYFGQRRVEASLLRAVLERAHMQKSVAIPQEFNSKDLDSEDLYSVDDLEDDDSISKVIVVTTSINGQMTFEIEDQEPKAKKAKISDESMIEEQKSFYDLDSNQMVFEIEEPKAKKAKISDEQMFEKFFLD